MHGGVLTAVPGGGKTRTVTLVGAGDIAGCDFKADRKTARLLGKIQGTVFTLGDNAYPDGTRAQFRDCYGPTWGKYKKRTRPTAGNHEYHTPGAKPYFDYFGWRAGRPRRLLLLRSRELAHRGPQQQLQGGGWVWLASAQGRWLRRDLARHRARCTLAYFHHPLYASGKATIAPR